MINMVYNMRRLMTLFELLEDRLKERLVVLRLIWGAAIAIRLRFMLPMPLERLENTLKQSVIGKMWMEF